MRILVTGGSGYVGSRLLEQLAARADVEEIVNVDIRPPRAGGPRIRHVERSVTPTCATCSRIPIGASTSPCTWRGCSIRCRTA